MAIHFRRRICWATSSISVKCRPSAGRQQPPWPSRSTPVGVAAREDSQTGSDRECTPRRPFDRRCRPVPRGGSRHLRGACRPLREPLGLSLGLRAGLSRSAWQAAPHSRRQASTSTCSSGTAARDPVSGTPAHKPCLVRDQTRRARVNVRTQLPVPTRHGVDPQQSAPSSSRESGPSTMVSANMCRLALG
jgi:hypothetical protein